MDKEDPEGTNCAVSIYDCRFSEFGCCPDGVHTKTDA
jgi:hypothetical protein